MNFINNLISLFNHIKEFLSLIITKLPDSSYFSFINFVVGQYERQNHSSQGLAVASQKRLNHRHSKHCVDIVMCYLYQASPVKPSNPIIFVAGTHKLAESQLFCLSVVVFLEMCFHVICRHYHQSVHQTN